jgi:hypothetical protein
LLRRRRTRIEGGICAADPRSRWVGLPKMAVGFISPKCTAPSRPHAEEYRSSMRAQVLPTAVARCDASRSMRAHTVARPHPSRRAHARSSSQKGSGVRAPQDEDGHRLRHSSRFQTAHLVPAPALLRPGFASLASLTPSRGGRSAERRWGAQRSTRCACLRGTPGACEAPCVPYAGRTPPGAPPWRFLAPGSALPSPALPPESVQRAPRSQVLVPGGRGPVPPGTNGYEPPPQDATPRSAFRIVSRTRPQ